MSDHTLTIATSKTAYGARGWRTFWRWECSCGQHGVWRNNETAATESWKTHMYPILIARIERDAKVIGALQSELTLAIPVLREGGADELDCLANHFAALAARDAGGGDRE